MNGDKTSMGGFTIVETLIVLAVTGLLLFIAILTFAGQQAKVEFSQSVRDIQSVIQQTVNEVGSGHYQSGSDISCAVSGGTLSISGAAVGVEQGSNTGCIFMGKVMQFGVADTDPQQYNVFALAGLKDNEGTIAKAKPQVVNVASTTSNSPLHGGLRVVKMTYTDDSGPIDIGAVAFTSSLGGMDDNQQFLSGSQQLNLIPVQASGQVTSGTIDASVIEAVKQRLATAPINPKGGVQICFASGGVKQSGLITVGSSGRSLTVKLDIKSTTDCT